MAKIDVIAWDFDGVLNKNVVDNHFIWLDQMEAEKGYCPRSFMEQVISDFAPVMAGQVCLYERLTPWLEQVGHEGDAEEFANYWFNLDRYPDPIMHEVLEKTASAGVVNVMATNNEARRGRFVWHDMGFDQRMDKLYAAGEMKKIKPHAEFFHHIADDLKVDPSRVLMVDDLPENIKSARALGMHGHLFVRDQYDSLKSVLSDLVESSF